MSYDNMSEFARTIMEQKYSHILKDGTKENWNNIAYRVTKHVMKATGYDMRSSICKEIHEAIRDRKFLPAGRYLYSAGRPFHQISNCLLLRAEDSREGWADLLHKSSMALMTGAGIGIVYSDVRGKNKKIRKEHQKSLSKYSNNLELVTLEDYVFKVGGNPPRFFVKAYVSKKYVGLFIPTFSI